MQSPIGQTESEVCTAKALSILAKVARMTYTASTLLSADVTEAIEATDYPSFFDMRAARPSRSARVSNTSRSMTMSSKEQAQNAVKVQSLGLREGEVFVAIGKFLYDFFQKEDEIDKRRSRHFLDNIDTAPEQTTSELALVEKTLDTCLKIRSDATRLPGTVNESVEKLLRSEKGDRACWGMTKATIDVSAEELFSDVWILDSYKSNATHKQVSGDLPRAIWENLDGTRSLQYIKSLKFPKGISNRYFDCWLTWEARTREDGRKEFIIAWAPSEVYGIMGGSTHHFLKETQKMMKGSSKGVYIIRELTKNTCELNQILNADLNLALPKAIMDMIAKANLSWANRVQEEYRRNGREVDKETHLALAEVIRSRRGMPLTSEQEVSRWEGGRWRGRGAPGDDEL